MGLEGVHPKFYYVDPPLTMSQENDNPLQHILINSQKGKSFLFYFIFNRYIEYKDSWIIRLSNSKAKPVFPRVGAVQFSLFSYGFQEYLNL